MARETEIKLRIENVAAFRKKVKKLGAKPIKSAAGRMFEQNVIFDTPDGGLAKHGQLLRIRTERLGKSRSSSLRPWASPNSRRQGQPPLRGPRKLRARTADWSMSVGTKFARRSKWK